VTRVDFYLFAQRSGNFKPADVLNPVLPIEQLDLMERARRSMLANHRAI
jgi:hypothetical protein